MSGGETNRGVQGIQPDGTSVSPMQGPYVNNERANVSHEHKHTYINPRVHIVHTLWPAAEIPKF